MSKPELNVNTPELAGKIAEFLPEYILKPVTDDYHYNRDNYATLTDAEGRGIHFYFDSYRQTVTVSGNLPRDDRRNLYVNAERPSIKVSPTRDPKAIAADITRRLLPEYNELYARSIVLANEQKASIAAKTANVKAITDTLVDPRPYVSVGQSSYWDPIGLRANAPDKQSFEAIVWDTTVRLILSDLTVEETVKVLALLGYAKDEGK